MKSTEELLAQFPLPPAPRRLIRLGLIGLGGIVQNCHLPAIELLQSLGWPVRITALSDLDAGKCQKLRARFPESRIFTDALDLIHADSLDGVLICTWPPTTAKLIAQAIAASLPVFAEKPVSEDPEELATLAERAAGRVLVQIGYNRRSQLLAAPFRQCLAEIRSPRHLEVRLWRTMRNEPGFYRDTMVHPLNFLQYLLGKLRIRHAAAWPAVAQTSIPSGISADLLAADGTTIHLDARPAVGLHLESYEALGHRCALRLTYPPTEKNLPPVELVKYDGAEPQVLFYDRTDPCDASYMSLLRGFAPQLASFCRLVEDPRRVPVCTLSDAAETVDLCGQILAQANEEQEIKCW